MNQISALRDQLLALCPQMDLREDEPLSRHTSFRIGGPATLMALPKTKQEASLTLRAAKSLGIEAFLIGKGSNLLIADDGLPGFVLKYRSGEESLLREGEEILAGAGLPLSRLALFAMEEDLTGLEFAHGIPGSLGGAVFMNAGAYEGEMAQVVAEVTCLNREGEEEIFSAEQLDFSYRHSIFSDGTRLIVGVRLHLKMGSQAAISDKMKDLMERRRSKQPLDLPSAGSTFKRPPGHFAGTLIEQAGLKGAAVGGARVSEKHAGFVVNTGGASCEDVLRLLRMVRQVVWTQTGVLLEPEIRLVGCSL